ncbi:DUF2238 domain-containing protein [Candidatus Woesearchaeota archaeon]|nr:DUF2238 domain-containing protein [Candidatus Woesearchaeota archaeon]
MNQKRLLAFLSITVGLVLIWSLINPKDYGVWFLETFPVLFGFPILFFTYKKFKFTNITYTLIALHAIILIVGGHYTYADNPLFNWIRDLLNLDRNYYDRVGHFFQGFVPVLIAREILLKKTRLNKGKMLFFLLVCIIAFITSFYELLEWASTWNLPPEQGIDFLGSQGDLWDAQKDMTMAFIGGFIGLLFFSKIQDKQMKHVKKKKT